MPTSNFYIAENDGWVEIASAPTEVRVSGFPHSHPYYLYAGSSAPSLNSVLSTGTITVTNVSGGPTATETFTIGTEVYTFVAARAAPFEVTIGADETATAANIVAAITADSSLVSASNAAGVVTLVAQTLPGGYALSEAATDVAVSAANMTTGTEPVEGILMCHHPFETYNKMTDKLYARIVNPVPTAKRPNGKLRLDVFTIA